MKRKTTKRERKQILPEDQIASPERLFVFRLAKRFPNRPDFRRFLSLVKKAGCYYNHDTEERTVTVVFEDRESRDAGVTLLKRGLNLKV